MDEFLSRYLWLRHEIELKTLIDILIVSVLIYEVLKLVRGTRAVQTAIGLGLLALIYQISSWAGLTTVQWLLRNAIFYMGFAIIVLFNHEIRTALIHFGNNIRFPFYKRRRPRNPFGQEWYDEVVLAATTLASDKVGALMVFERDGSLRTYIESGTRLDARVNYDLLITIFNTHTTLHDGAVIISSNRITAACCFLPFTQNPVISRELGARHRAAIGVTEESDAFAVIVSEETGVISFAADGKLKRNLDGPGLRRMIQQAMEPWRSEDESEKLEAEERKTELQLDELTKNSNHKHKDAKAQSNIT